MVPIDTIVTLHAISSAHAHTYEVIMRELLTAEQAMLALSVIPSSEGRWPRICERTCPQTLGERGCADVL